MKLIKRSDLILLLNLALDHDGSFAVSDLEYLLNTYGNDWFIEGNKLVQSTENERMKELRNRYTVRYEVVLNDCPKNCW